MFKLTIRHLTLFLSLTNRRFEMYIKWTTNSSCYRWWWWSLHCCCRSRCFCSTWFFVSMQINAHKQKHFYFVFDQSVSGQWISTRHHHRVSWPFPSLYKPKSLSSAEYICLARLIEHRLKHYADTLLSPRLPASYVMQMSLFAEHRCLLCCNEDCDGDDTDDTRQQQTNGTALLDFTSDCCAVCCWIE